MEKDTPNNPASQLHEMPVAGLDPAFLDRLEASIEGTLTELSTPEQLFEARLGSIRPKPLNDQLFTALEKTAQRLPYPEHDAVLAFPTDNHASPPSRSWWRAAAAVAILGGLSALMVGTGPEAPVRTADATPVTPPTRPSTTDASALIPAEFSRNLSETSDEGIIWPSEGRPHRVLKVTYMDKVTLKREDGSSYQAQKPRVEYYIVPTESH